MTTTEFLSTLFRLLEEADLHDALYWHCRRSDGPSLDSIEWGISCDDVFAWGTADIQQIWPGNIHLLQEAMDEIRAVGGELWMAYVLFCAKARQRRPQGAAYPQDQRVWPLLDACGPPREMSLLNPQPHP